MSSITDTMRILEPYPGVLAYYDGRIEGKRLYSEGTNWLDDGAYSLGIASYAVVDGTEALVYDTHMSIAHAEAIRRDLQGRGVRDIRVVLSHWHNDHVAGNAVFGDCEIIALALTADRLEENRSELESDPPPISPLVLPNRLFEGELDLRVGDLSVELRHFDIHSADGCVLWLPDRRVLLAGDTLEDTVTYVSEAAHLGTHVRELSRLSSLPIDRILPNHGDPNRISNGGYEKSLIDANRSYLERLLDPEEATRAHSQSLREFVAQDIAAGSILYFKPYETVHRANVAAVDHERDHDVPDEPI